MSKKTHVIVSTIITVVSGAAISLINLFEVPNAGIINSAIDIITGAVLTIFNLFGPDIAAKFAKKD
jgi:hypothetical protein